MSVKSYFDKDGNKKWKINVYLGIDPLTGKEKRTNRQGLKSEAEAKRLEARLIAGVEKREVKQPTFKEVYDDWIILYKDTVKPSTYARTVDAFRLHILPDFSNNLIDKITIKHCQDWVNKKSKEIVKYKEYSNYIKRLFNFAIGRGYRKDNPCTALIYPKMTAKKGKSIDFIWSKKELEIFLNVMEKDYSIKWYAFFRLLAYTGMRRGEILALEWSDFDITKRNLTISKSRKRVLDGEVTGDTKTGKERNIVIDLETIKILMQWRQTQLKVQGRQKIMFTNSKQTYMLLNHPNKILQAVTKKYDLPKIDIHRFRHIHTSMLIEANPNEGAIAAVMDRLGHADIKTTMNIYTHVMESKKQDILDNYLEYLEN